MGLCAASHSDGAGAGLPPGAFSLCFDSQLNAACSQLQAGNPLSVNQVGKNLPPEKKTRKQKEKNKPSFGVLGDFGCLLYELWPKVSSMYRGNTSCPK